MRVSGIDVSHHQGAIDWPAVARAGISFAFMKCTEGVQVRDHRFAANWKAAQQAGIACGAYHFFHPAQPIAAQADHFCSALAAAGGPGDLPPVLDVEETVPTDEWPEIPRRRRLECCIEWLKEVEKRLGTRPAVYTRRSFVAAMFGSPGALAVYPLWIAHYTLRPEPACPAGWRWTFWQHTDSGRVPGISGNVDLNRFSGSPAEFRAMCGGIAVAA